MRARPGLRRAGWGIGDQALSSATNFALALVVARSVSTAEFGSFALVFAVYTVFLGAARALTTEPLALGYAAAAPDRRAEATRTVAGAALALGALAGAGCALAGVLASGSTRSSLLALSITLPGLLLQDAWRLSFFVDGRGRSAFLNDALWAVLLAAALWWSGDDPTAPELLLAWGGAATGAALAGAVQSGAVPDLRGIRGWFREHRKVVADLTGDFAALTASAHLWLFGAGAVAGLSGVGALRGGQVLLGPLNVLFMGAALVAVPEAVKWHRLSPETLVRRCLALSAALGGASLVWGVSAMLLPDAAGEALLGETWGPAGRTIPPLTVWMVFSGVVAGLALGLRAAGRTRRGLRVRAATGAASVAAATAGAALAGARGAAWALAGATAAGCVLWWRELKKVASEPPHPPAPAVTAETLAGGVGI